MHKTVKVLPMVKLRALQWCLICAAGLSLGLSVAAASQEVDRAEIDRYSREAEEALANKNLQKAATALEKLAQLTPNVAEVHGNLGMVYYTEGQYSKAAVSFQQALKLDSKMTTAELMLGICLAELGRHKEAVPLLEPAYQHPPDPEIARLIGLELQRAYWGLREYAKANAVSDELLTRYPKDPEVLYYASRLHADQALRSMFQLIREAPESSWVRRARAEVFESQRDYALAIKEYQIILRMDPQLPGVNFQLGRVLLLSSESEATRNEAMKAFEAELAIDPQNSDAWYEIGEIRRRRGQFEQAAKAFLQAVKYHAEFEEAQIALGRTLATLGKPEEALPHLLTAIRLNPTNEVSHFLLASVYKALGNLEHYREEMEQFHKYHFRPYARVASSPSRSLAGVTDLPPKVTKQELERNSESQSQE